MLCFFRSLIDFDWIEGHLISGRVGFGSGSSQFDFLKKSGRIRSGSGPDGSGGFLGSGRVLPPLDQSYLFLKWTPIYPAKFRCILFSIYFSLELGMYITP
jgi:hypothetical protein